MSVFFVVFRVFCCSPGITEGLVLTGIDFIIMIILQDPFGIIGYVCKAFLKL